MIASEGSEKKRAVPSAPKPKTLRDCLIRNVSAVMRYNSSRLADDLFLLRGLQISDELSAILRKPWRRVQALVGTARLQLGGPVSHAELGQGEHERLASGTWSTFGVSLSACKSSPSEGYCSSLRFGVTPGGEYHSKTPR
jgi:hypothetical protein